MTNQHHSSGLDPAQPRGRTGSPLDRWQWVGEYTQHVGLLPRQSAVLAWMAHFGIDGLCTASQETLAANSGYSVRTVRDAQRELRALGAATLERESKGRHDGAAHHRLAGASTGWYVQSIAASFAGVDAPKPAKLAAKPAKLAKVNRQSSPVKPAILSPQQASPGSEEHDTNVRETHAREDKLAIKNGDFPLITPEFYAEMEEKYADAPFDVRLEIAAALGHGKAREWDRTDIYVDRWLKRELHGRPGAKRMAVETDWKKDFFEGTDLEGMTDSSGVLDQT